eukprot:1151637-Pelagomonas_calceolata.AAC.5
MEVLGQEDQAMTGGQMSLWHLSIPVAGRGDLQPILKGIPVHSVHAHTGYIFSTCTITQRVSFLLIDVGSVLTAYVVILVLFLGRVLKSKSNCVAYVHGDKACSKRTSADTLMKDSTCNFVALGYYI